MSNNTSRRSSLIHHHCNYNHPSSFSSSLLEQIYRSFDDQDIHQNCDSLSYGRENKYEREDRLRVNGNFNHRYDLDQWIHKSDNKISLRRNSMVEVNAVEKFNSFSSSSTSSSDSSSGIGGFSSSESESTVYMSSKSKTKTKNLTLKPIRTSFNPPEFHRKSYSDEIPVIKKSSHGNKKEGNLQKRALKLYGDLKKVRQPISPGGKLASFLNSLFNSTSSKKAKISTSSSSSYGEKFSTSMPSTASSYARSCLSKTPSSAGRFERRSVRFCPANTVIAATDNECNVIRKERVNDNEELKVKIMEKHRRVEEVAKELLKNYHGRKYQNDVVNMMSKSTNTNDNGKTPRCEVENEDEEDDDVSCCSSDLFELENWLDIGVDPRYRQELPVYETTHVRNYSCSY